MFYLLTYLLKTDLYSDRLHVSNHIHTTDTANASDTACLSATQILTYTVGLVGLIERHGFCPHLYADSTKYIWYDAVYLRALKSWRDGQPNLVHGTETKK